VFETWDEAEHPRGDAGLFVRNGDGDVAQTVSSLNKGKWRQDSGYKDLNRRAKEITPTEAAEAGALIRSVFGEEVWNDAKLEAERAANQIGSRLSVSKRLDLLQVEAGIMYAGQELASAGHDEDLARSVLYQAVNEPGKWTKERIVGTLETLKAPYAAAVGAERLFKPHQSAQARKHFADDEILTDSDRKIAQAFFDRHHRGGSTPLVRDAFNARAFYAQFESWSLFNGIPRVFEGQWEEEEHPRGKGGLFAKKGSAVDTAQALYDEHVKATRGRPTYGLSDFLDVVKGQEQPNTPSTGAPPVVSSSPFATTTPADMPEAPKLPPGTRYAGDTGVARVPPEAGMVAWTTNPESGQLQAVKILGTDGAFDQYTRWKFTWLDGPDKGTTDSGYGRTFYQAETQPQSTPQPKGPVTETPEFKSWFGNSQVKDDTGQPLRVYHGTAKEFSEFGGPGSTSDLAAIGWHYFSSNPEFAGKFSGSEEPLDFEPGKEPEKPVRPADATVKAHVMGDDGAEQTLETPAWSTKTPGLVLRRLSEDGDLYGVLHAASGFAVGSGTFKQAEKLAGDLKKLSVDWTMPQEQMMAAMSPETKKEAAQMASKARDASERERKRAARSATSQIDPVTLQWKSSTIGVGSQIVPAFLKMEKPIDLRSLGIRPQNPDKLIQVLAQHGIDMTIADMPFSGRRPYQMLNDASVAEKIQRQAKAKGFDGIIFKDYYDAKLKADSFIVFDAAQIKSATGNRGTFDPTSGRFGESEWRIGPSGRPVFEARTIMRGDREDPEWEAMQAKRASAAPVQAQTDANWDESAHPRGGAKNKGQFAHKGEATPTETAAAVKEPEFINIGTGERAKALHHMLENPDLLDEGAVGVAFAGIHQDQYDDLTKAITKVRPDLADASRKAQQDMSWTGKETADALTTKETPQAAAAALKVGEEVTIDGEKGKVISVRTQTRKTPAFHPTDPKSTWSGTDTQQLTTVKIENSWAQTSTHTFRGPVTKDEGWKTGEEKPASEPGVVKPAAQEQPKPSEKPKAPPMTLPLASGKTHHDIAKDAIAHAKRKTDEEGKAAQSTKDETARLAHKATAGLKPKPPADKTYTVKTAQGEVNVPDAEAAKIKGLEDVEFITHKTMAQNRGKDPGKMFTLTDAKSGMALGYGASREAAVANAEKRIGIVGIDAVKQRLQAAHQKADANQAEGERLRKENAGVMATPLMSEGGMEVEGQIRQLQKPADQVAKEEAAAAAKKQAGRILQLTSYIQTASNFRGKNGKVLPKYQREIDKANAELATLQGTQAAAGTGNSAKVS
jgi:hypothetical protein